MNSRKDVLQQGLRLALAAVLTAMALPAAADFNYSNVPLFQAEGVNPNVVLLLDASASMNDRPIDPDTGLVKTSGDTKWTTMKATANQVINDNYYNTRIGLFSFNGSNASLKQECGASKTDLINSVTSGMSTAGGTPLASAYYDAIKYIRGDTGKSPVQYRCQKNYVVMLTDGNPSTGFESSNSSLSSTVVQNSGDTTSGSGNPWGSYTLDFDRFSSDAAKTSSWDGYPDPRMHFIDTAGTWYYFPLLDDFAKFGYDNDFRSNSSASKTGLCPNGSTPANGKDCAGKKWNDDDTGSDNLYALQNIIPYTIGFDVENELLRDATRVNRIAFSPADVDVAKRTIKIPSHGLETGNYVTYGSGLAGIVNAANDTVTGVGIATGTKVTYSNGGGTALTYSQNIGAASNGSVPSSSVDTGSDFVEVTKEAYDAMDSSTPITYNPNGGGSGFQMQIPLTISSTNTTLNSFTVTGNTAKLTTSTPLGYATTGNAFKYQQAITQAVSADAGAETVSVADATGATTATAFTYNNGGGANMTFDIPADTDTITTGEVAIGTDVVTVAFTNNLMTAQTALTYNAGGGQPLLYQETAAVKVAASSANIDTTNEWVRMDTTGMVVGTKLTYCRSLSGSPAVCSDSGGTRLAIGGTNQSSSSNIYVQSCGGSATGTTTSLAINAAGNVCPAGTNYIKLKTSAAGTAVANISTTGNTNQYFQFVRQMSATTYYPVSWNATTTKLALSAGGAAVDIVSTGNNAQSLSWSNPAAYATNYYPATGYSAGTGTFGISLTAGGPVLDITGEGDPSKQQLTYTRVFDASGVFYPTTVAGTFGLSLLPASSAVDVTVAGTGTQTLTYTATAAANDTYYPILTCTGCGDAGGGVYKIKLSTSAGGTAIDITGSGNDAQTLKATIDLPDGEYYAISAGGGSYKLALSAADALAGKSIDILGAGGSAQTFVYANVTGLYPFETDQQPMTRNNIISVTPDTTASAVRTFNVYSTENMVSGTPVVFSKGSSNLGYTDNDTYYLIVVNSKTFKLASSKANAIASTPVAVSASCPATCTTKGMELLPVPQDNIWDRGKYFAVKVDEDHIRLALSAAKATACESSKTPPDCVDIAGAGSGVLSTGPGKTYFATDATSLSAALNAAFLAIRDDKLGMAGLSHDGERVQDGVNIYQPRFNPADWSGDIVSYPVSLLDFGSFTTEDLQPFASWVTSDAGLIPTGSARTLLTIDPTAAVGSRGKVFDTTSGNLTTAQQTALTNGGTATLADVVNWLRGTTPTGYRKRTNTIMGDIIGSSPQIAAKTDNEGYAGSASSLSVTIKDEYTQFLNQKIDRPNMLYFGANDGMVHGLETVHGKEMLAFIPNGSYSAFTDADNDGVKDAAEVVDNKLYATSRSDYGVPANPHRYFVDGTPTIGDAYFTDNDWHTVLVGGMGAGGRSIYALDVTDPVKTSDGTSKFGPANVLWEFTDAELGFTYSRPQIARTNSTAHPWVAIFGNGYDSGNDKAQLFVVNLETGELVRKIDTQPTGSTIPTPNGLSSVAVKKAADLTVEAVYAGDLQGNVWKFDLSDSNPLDWKVAYDTAGIPAPLFTAYDNSTVAKRQPITGGVTLGTSPTGTGTMVYFGTGKYFETGDKSYDAATASPRVNSAYAILDDGTKFGNSTRSSLLVEREITGQINGTGANSATVYRTMTELTDTTTDPPPAEPGYGYAVNYPTERGWFFDLVISTNYKGELIMAAPQLRGQRALFTTIIPNNTDPCTGGGTGSLMEVSARDGTTVGEIFDTNGDGKITACTAANPTNCDQRVAGMESSSGVMSTPVILDKDTPAGETNKTEVKYIATSTGNIMVVLEDNEDDPVSEGETYLQGRMSWRQLQ